MNWKITSHTGYKVESLPDKSRVIFNSYNQPFEVDDVVGFGKHAALTFQAVCDGDPRYLAWLLSDKNKVGEPAIKTYVVFSWSALDYILKSISKYTDREGFKVDKFYLDQHKNGPRKQLTAENTENAINFMKNFIKELQ